MKHGFSYQTKRSGLLRQYRLALRLFIFLSFSVLSFSRVEAAEILIGSGFNSSTGGRVIPTLNLGANFKDLEVQFTSVGVATDVYYHSTYKLAAFSRWEAGDFLTRPIDAGFGGGVLYAERGFKDSGASETTKSDYVLGPAFFVRVTLIGPLYLSVDCVYGIIGSSSRSGDVLALNARDHVNLAIGVRW